MAKRFAGTLPLEGLNWKVGAIVGRSGTGKSTIAKEVFGDAYVERFEYSADSVLDDFPAELTVSEITSALSFVGFASPPDWLKPYSCLSQGEKMRTDIARAMCLNRTVIAFDEFTSVIDREIAKIASLAINHAIRKSGKQFVAVTCHPDVLDWLEPDWVYYPELNTFEDCTGTLAEGVLPSGTKVVVKKKECTHLWSSRSGEYLAASGQSLGNITI